MGQKLKLVVLGMMGLCPFGGQTWLYLNWLRGLHRLGHDVWYVEDDISWPYDPIKDSVDDKCEYAVKHIAHCMQRIGMEGKWAYRLAGVEGACWGLSPAELNALYRDCDGLLNIVGSTDLREEQMAAPRRVYIQTDPVTSELALAKGDAHTIEAFGNHHVIATYGENYKSEDCGVPLSGIDDKYVLTRQPIDVDLWPMSYDPDAPYFTTIGNYKQRGSDIDYQGDTYFWSKHHEWEKFIKLPCMTDQKFSLALNVDAPEDRHLLESNGWQLSSPLKMSLDIFGKYPEFFRESRGQFTVAKDQNIRLRSGWFSERDVCYLSTGKPVVTQETGFSNILPTGEGLFGVSTVEEAAAAIDEINSDYEKHCNAARELAHECFECSGVAQRMLEATGLL